MMMRYWIGVCDRTLMESAEVKLWYDALTRETMPVRAHHWTDVEDNPTRFAQFDDAELDDLAGEYAQEWLAAKVFDAHWVRIAVDSNRWFLQGHLKDIRKAMRDVVPRDTSDEVIIEATDASSVTLQGAAIERFIRSGRIG